MLWKFFFKRRLLIVFGRYKFKCLTAVVLKRLFRGKCIGSTAAVVWHLLTVEEAETKLVAAEVLAVQWWLEERWLVVACQVVKSGCSVSICW